MKEEGQNLKQGSEERFPIGEALRSVGDPVGKHSGRVFPPATRQASVRQLSVLPAQGLLGEKTVLGQPPLSDRCLSPAWR